MPTSFILDGDGKVRFLHTGFHGKDTRQEYITEIESLTEIMFMKNKAVFLLAFALLVLGTGCANVKPWQRETLTDYTMQPDRDPLGTAQAEHIGSREEANGGSGVGGGGCGCN